MKKIIFLLALVSSFTVHAASVVVPCEFQVYLQDHNSTRPVLISQLTRDIELPNPIKWQGKQVGAFGSFTYYAKGDDRFDLYIQVYFKNDPHNPNQKDIRTGRYGYWEGFSTIKTTGKDTELITHNRGDAGSYSNHVSCQFK